MGNVKKKIGSTLKSLIPDALAIAGAFFIGFGAGMIYIPAGVICIGCLLIAGAVIYSRGG